MTYTFKLSRRLAIARIAAVGAAVLAAACSTSDLTESAADDDVAALVVSPEQTTIPAGTPAQLSVHGISDAGDTVSVDQVEWSASGGAITSTGVFTATSPGTYQLVVKRRGRRSKPDTGTVVVTDPTLQSIELTPASATLEPGATQQFTATGRMSDGSTRSVTVTYVATGGTISGTGNYTAGSTAGDYRVIATETGGLADTSSVTISAEPPPPPPPAGSGACGHEPSGYTIMSDRQFASLDEGWWYPEGDSEIAIVSAGYGGAAPKSPSQVGRIKFPKGFGDGASPARTSTDVTRSRQLYTCFWVQLSPNWYGHQVNSKIGYLWTGGKPKIYFNFKGAGTSDQRFQIKLQDMNVDAAGGNTMKNELADPILPRGQWHRIEMLVTVNTMDQANGTLEAWVNGQKVLERRDLNYNGTKNRPIDDSDNYWHKVEWNPIWGGQSDQTPTVPDEQYMYMDHFYISGD